MTCIASVYCYDLHVIVSSGVERFLVAYLSIIFDERIIAITDPGVNLYDGLEICGI